jgi:type III restriction enzyme
MNTHTVNTICNRLSLRKPQRISLESIDKVCDILTLGKSEDIKSQLDIIKSEFPDIVDFERDFPSMCFALATGVGKTRLMGAFITYLYQVQKVRHFMVLAPNLTIYNKLIADFTPNTPKYVFQGIGEFATNMPIVITGDNYENGFGVRGSHFFEDHIHINIFNISKITAKDKGKYDKDDERKNIPRIRRLSECIGESYFDYLAGLDDLVLLMDESHRYRADAGMAAINELKPILGLELTATPQVEKQSKAVPFKNVIYNYPLSNAMQDGYVKEPAVATRENFNASNYDKGRLERIKLEDGIRIHENTKVELDVYSRNNDKPLVKPFMLVVAENTDHAAKIKEIIEDDDFFDGDYKGKVITVHSKVKGEEKDDVVEQLLTVEKPENPVEVVIHVNMLKEGWDVTNLYTIVPLRAANSRTLVEQSIGRGLRLPYGKRVGVDAVDRLTIVSHDKFQEIVDHANDPDSIIKRGIVIGKDISDEKKKSVHIPTAIESFIRPTVIYPGYVQPKESILKVADKHKDVAYETFKVVNKIRGVSKSADLSKKEIREEIAIQVEKNMSSEQLTFDSKKEVIDKVVKEIAEKLPEMTIDVPKIIVVPKGEVTSTYREFKLELGSVKLQPVSKDILVQHLNENKRYTLKSSGGIAEEKRLEDYLVRGLIDYDDISYDDHAELLYKLAGQVIQHLQSYLNKEEKVVNVLQYHQKQLVELIHTQMEEHFEESASQYEVVVSEGFQTLRAEDVTMPEGEKLRDFRIPIPDGKKKSIKSMLFGNFNKCIYIAQKFDSDSERRFAILLENDSEVKKWFKPSHGQFKIHYSHNASYEPDFVVETDDSKYLCEPKMKKEMDDSVVLAKAKAASEWCKNATEQKDKLDGKPWVYCLIPHDVITEQMTFGGIVAGYIYE